MRVVCGDSEMVRTGVEALLEFGEVDAGEEGVP